MQSILFFPSQICRARFSVCSSFLLLQVADGSRVRASMACGQWVLPCLGCWIWSMALLHAPPTDHTCGWLDQRLLSSSFISTPAGSFIAAMVGRLAPLKFFFCPFFIVFQPPFLFLSLFYNELLLVVKRKGE